MKSKSRRAAGFFPAIFVLAISCFRAAEAQTGVLLAENGKAMQPIAVSKQASKETQAVAKDLAQCLNRITGGTFAVKAGDGKAGIVIGTLAEFPVAELDKPLELRERYNGIEAYAIRTEARRVLLLGRTDKGASHAVSRFLETLGYRHYFPAKEWEVFPSKPTIRYNMTESGRPHVLSRNIWAGFGLFDGQAGTDYDAWKRHNRLDKSFVVRAGHAWYGIVRTNKAKFDAHPEYFALVKQADGTLKRQGPMIELGNPAVRQMVVDQALASLRNNPEEDMFSIEPADGRYLNESPESKAYGASVSDQLFGLANEVARAIQKKFPGKMVGLLAYSNHTDPPSFELEPNVYVQLTHGFNYSERGLTFEQLASEWSRKCKNLGFYAYFSVWQSDRDRLPMPSVRGAEKWVRFYAERSGSSIAAESSANWGPRGLYYYVAARLMWDPKTDVDQLLADFYENAFGPAAAPMRRFYQRLGADTEYRAEIRLSSVLLRQAADDLVEASTLAKDRPDVQARLEHLKQYLVFHDLREKFDSAGAAVRKEAQNAEKREAFRKAGLDLLSFVYRTRYSYMEHWRPMETELAKGLAKYFNEPSWNYVHPGVRRRKNTPPRPWEVKESLSHEESEQLFQQVRAGYSTVEVESRKYSNDLVPVSFPQLKSRKMSFGGRSGGKAMRFALYSIGGEPLRFSVTPGSSLVKGRLAGRPAIYTLTSADGKAVSKGELAQDKQVKELEIKVPRAGLYFLNYEEFGGGAKFLAVPGLPVALLLDKETPGTVSIPPLYFYVPKGLRNIQFFTQDARPHSWTVRGPDDKVARVVGTKSKVGEVVNIPVPEGQDGKVWWFHDFAFGRLRMLNLPEFVSFSPNQLLVPREVAEKDGLQIATATAK